MARRGTQQRIDLFGGQGIINSTRLEDDGEVEFYPEEGDLDQRPIARYQDWSTPYITDLVTRLWSLVKIDDPDFALAHDVASIEKIRRDAVIQQLTSLRKHLVAGRKWHLEPGDDTPEAKELSSVLSWLIRKNDNFVEARYRLSDAVFIGLAVEKMLMKHEWMKVPDSVSRALGGQYLPFVYCHKFHDIDKRRIRLEYTDSSRGLKRHYYRTIFNVHRREWRKLSNPEQYIFHVYNNEEDTYRFGRGLNEAIFYYWRGKAFLLKYCQQFCEAFAKPWISAKIDTLKGTGASLEARQRAWLRALEKMRGHNVVVGGSEDDFQFMNAPTGGQQILLELLKYFDDALTRLIVGSELAVQAGEQGSRALGEVHESTKETYINYDREILQNRLSKSLVQANYEANYSILESAGLTDCELPRFVIDSKVTEEPLDVLQQISLARQNGMKIALEEAHERSGWRMPAEDEETVGEEEELMQHVQQNEDDALEGVQEEEEAAIQQSVIWVPRRKKVKVYRARRIAA